MNKMFNKNNLLEFFEKLTNVSNLLKEKNKIMKRTFVALNVPKR